MNLAELQRAGHNFAEDLSEEERSALASTLISLIEADNTSRADWLRENEEWHKLAAQLIEKKNTPWNNASNIKFPLLTLTSVHFQARASKDLLASPDIVRTKIIGLQKRPEDEERGRRIAHALSYQLQEVIPNWMEDMEQGLMVLPLYGMFFKKTYYNPTLDSPISKLVFPTDLIYHYGSNDFNRCRKTELIRKYPNEIAEYVESGYYVDYDFTEGGTVSRFDDNTYMSDDDDAPRMLLECHCWWDLDGDGYKEPWVITIDENANEIVRISARFDPEDITEHNRKVVHIKATEYYTQYGCIPSFNSKTYFSGFGQLLGPVNSGVNTILNQLIDAGTLSNLPSGFISRGLRVRKGEQGFGPGEWKQTMSNSGEPLQKHIFPLPVPPPSPVLFNLLGMLIQAGKEIGSLSDLVLGNNPGQNQPWNTTQQVLAQGLQVYSGVFKNVHRAMTAELKLLAMLNKTYLKDEVYNDILGIEEQQFTVVEDFDFSNISVLPTAEPNTVTEQQRLEKSARLLELAANGLPINPTIATRRVLEAEGHENIEEIMQMPEPQPSFEQQIEMQKLQLEMQKFQKTIEMEQKNSQYEAFKDMTAAQLNMAKAQQIGDQQALSRATLEFEMAKQKHAQEEADFKKLLDTAKMQGEQEKRNLDYDVQRRAAEAKARSGGGQS